MIDDFTEDESNYRRLWLCVILRAKQDAEGRNMMCECNPASAPEVQKEALEFLSVPTAELEWVAWAAGVEMGSLLEVGRGIRESAIGTERRATEPPFYGDAVRVRGETEGEHGLRQQRYGFVQLSEGERMRDATDASNSTPELSPLPRNPA